MFQITADAAGQRAVPQRKQDGIELLVPLGQLQSDGPRSLPRFHIAPVLNQSNAALSRNALRLDLCRIEILAMQHDRRSELSHSLQLERVRVHAGVYRESD